MPIAKHKPAAAWLNAFTANEGGKPWGSLALAFLLVVLAGGLVWGARSFSAASQWVGQTNQERLDIENILVAISEAESAHRGYLLSGDPELRRQSLVSQGKSIDLSSGLPLLLADNPAQKTRAERLKLLVRERSQVIEEVAKVYQKEGFEKAQTKWLDLRQGNFLTMQTTDLVQQMVAEEHRLLKVRQGKTAHLAWFVQGIALLGITIAIALVVLSGLAYRREARIRDRATRATQAANDELALSLAGVERDHASTQALANFASLLQGCQSIEEICTVSTHSIPQILPDTSGTFYLMRTSGDHAEAYVDWGNHWKERPESILAAQCWGLRQGRPFRADEGSLCCPHREGSPLLHSTCVPMMVQGSEVGLLFISHEDNWNSAAMAEAASEQLSLAIINLRLRETLRTQSLRDPLTGLSNRREFDEQLPKEIARSQRNGQPMSLMILDIDHFKRFNDTFGHDAGDAVLREFAHLLKKSMRTEDLLARMGGEEFIIVLPNTALEHASILAERLRSQVESMEVVYRGSSVGKITTSIGIAECPQHACETSSLVATADVALYRAKAAGRNRIELSDGSMDLPVGTNSRR